MKRRKKIVIYIDEVRELSIYPERDPLACWHHSSTFEFHILLTADKAKEVTERIYKECLKK